MKPELIYDAPPGSLLMISDSGFINTNLFYEWIRHFQTFKAKSESKDSVLLILDNYSSHINLDVIDYYRNTIIQYSY